MLDLGWCEEGSFDACARTRAVIELDDVRAVQNHIPLIGKDTRPVCLIRILSDDAHSVRSGIEAPVDGPPRISSPPASSVMTISHRLHPSKVIQTGPASALNVKSTS